MEDLKLDLNFTDILSDNSTLQKMAQKKNIKDNEQKRSHRRTVKCLELSLDYEMRRAFSEQRLWDAMGGIKELKENTSYNFITAGDVDALSYLQLILRYQSLDYCLFSTWCMGAEDILKFDEWFTNGTIKKLDAYVGEIFPGTYKIEWQMLNELFKKHEGCGRIAVFRNHSKIFAGYGQKFHFGIQTSCNINTNPRTENGCITISRELFQFYKDYFDGIQSFVREKKS